MGINVSSSTQLFLNYSLMYGIDANFTSMVNSSSFKPLRYEKSFKSVYTKMDLRITPSAS